MAVGSICGSLVMGYIVDKKGIIFSIHCCIAYTVLIYIIAILVNEIHVFGPLSYVFAFGHGVYDALLHIIKMNILGFEFESKITPFSACTSVQSLIVFAMTLLHSIVKTKENFRIYFAVCLTISIVAQMSLLKFDFKSVKSI